jgi:hypothetical protein
MNRASYTMELMTIVGSIPEDQRPGFINAFQASEKNPVVLFGFNYWLGFLGIDRFLVGDVVAGILKLLTLGGFGIWVIVDYFLIGGRARDKNIEMARRLRDSFGRAQASSPAPASAPPPPGGDNPPQG